jgi:hypothetical protein
VDRPIQTILEILGMVSEELRQAQRAPTILQSSVLYDRALDLLFNAMNLSQPLAVRREADGRRAFLWVDGDPKNPDYRYLVSLPNGTFVEGTEKSQEACEAAVARILTQQ